MNVLELERMARRGAEDGHGDEWHPEFTASARVLASMKTAANEARIQMQNEELLTAILNELRAIRSALSNRSTPVAAPAAQPAAQSKDIPQPTEIVADPGSVEVHFGKNAGTPLRSLGAKSVEWYAQEPEPRLGKNGKPFPPRAEDVRLRNAARQIVHGNRGTLAAGSKITLVTETLTEEVPF